MLKRIETSKSAFVRFFTEADDDNTENNGDKVTVNIAPKQPAGTDYDDDNTNVNIRPSAGGGTDYTKGAEDTPEQEDDTTNDTDDQNDTITDDAAETDNTEDDEDGAEDYAENEDTATDDGAEEETDDTAEDEETGEDDATDYTADDGGDDNNDTTEGDDGNGQTEQPNEDENDGNKKDGEQRKKYVMYTRFIKLHSVIDRFITKLHTIVKNDVTENAVIKVVSNNLIDLKNNIYEYMTVKYKSASYLEIHIFYETAISCVRLNFSLLSTNNINI